jgi:hypothetical protein
VRHLKSLPLFLVSFSAFLCAQPRTLWAGLPETKLKYQIDAEVDPASRQLKGKVVIRWQGPADRSIKTLPLHLYLNAFAHQKTTWMRSARPDRKSNERFLKQNPDPWGYIESLSIRQRVGETLSDAKWRPIRPDDQNPLDRSLVEVALPQPISAGGTLVLEIDYVARLPVPIARTGCTPDFCLVAQWYPKLAMYEEGKWAARQFHGPTEFYAEFADFEVSLRAPKQWQMVSTGMRLGKAKAVGNAQLEHRFVQRAVHDFTFAIGREMEIHKATHRLPNHGVAMAFMLPKGLGHQFPRWRDSVTGAMDQLSKYVGPYPYRDLTVVMPNWRARRTGGMEYPTLITGDTADALDDHFLLRDLRFGEFTLIHEYIHQYFYGLLASNEQQEAYLDEGFNTYWSVRIAWALYGRKTSFGSALGRTFDIADWVARRVEQGGNKILEPISKRPAALFYPGSAGNQIYMRPALAWLTAEGLFGRDKVDRIFAEYYRRYAFGHPNGRDFLSLVRDVGGEEMFGFFKEAFEQPTVPDYRVVKLKSARWKAPLGRVEVKNDVKVVTKEDQDVLAEEMVDRELIATGRIRVEITEPGYSEASFQVEGKILRRNLKAPTEPLPEALTRGIIPATTSKKAKTAKKAEGEKEKFFESRVRLVGPAWRHLPVVVRFVFEDGQVVDDHWNGRSPWRAYRFIRRAKLQKVVIDPDGKIAMDARPQNNSRQRNVDEALARDWGYWLGAAGNWLLEGASLWF